MLRLLRLLRKLYRLLVRLWQSKGPDGFREVERDIFDYFDGTRWRVGDPVALHRRLLQDAGFNWEFDPGICAVPGLQGMEAVGRVAGAVRRVFAIPELDSGGLADAECIGVFTAFTDYVSALREKYRPLASSLPSTEAAAVPETTKPIAECNLTPADNGPCLPI